MCKTEVIGTTVVRVFENWTQVILPNGRVLDGAPTEDQREIAEEIGYSNITEMCLEHDPMHVKLCGFLGLSCSYALRVASGEEGMTDRELDLAGLEEDAVLAVLKFQKQVQNRAR